MSGTGSTALDRILAYKRGEVEAAKSAMPQAELEARLETVSPPRGFADALAAIVETGENALICELKRKSPSAGEILPGADPLAIACEYEAGGAACLSILTDGPSFGGSLADLTAVRETVSLPLLRKDFMIDPWQVIEARAHGADAILVILAAVDDLLARQLCDVALSLGMDVLAEVHNEVELARAVDLPVRLMGINNRNLKTMTTDLTTTGQLASGVPEAMDLISESGVTTPEDIKLLRQSGARRFLIGESLMKKTDRSAAVAALRAAGD
ncbi:MAG: indole-3-glycerol phosphate synthase TrpC [Hyphomonadaceae bacterium]|nr:indole-3-glycerol phosphate synthase TrpC [Hyphomonadaceae bacterium]